MLRLEHRYAGAIVALMFLASGCGSILGLDDFGNRPSGATDASGNPSGAGAAGSGGQGGGGGGDQGGGGAAPVYECSVGEEFDIFAPSDLPGAELVNDSLVLVPTPAAGRVHVAVVDHGSETVFARSVLDSHQSSSIASYAIGGVNPHLTDGYSKVGSVSFVGGFDDIAGEISFDLSGDIELGTGKLLPYAEPPSCGDVGKVLVSRDAAVTHFVAMCQAATAQRLLFGGAAGNSSNDFVLAGSQDQDDLRVVSYAFAGGQSVILLGRDDAEPGWHATYRFGNDEASLSKAYALDPEPGLPTFVRGARPTQDDKGVVLFTLTFDPTKLQSNPSARVRSGVVPLDELADLRSAPATYLSYVQNFTEKKSFADWSSPAKQGPTLVGAGVAGLDKVAPHGIRLFLWADDGTPLVFSKLMSEAPAGVSYLKANAAALGPGDTTLVAWIQRNDEGIYAVRGLLTSCKPQR